MEATGKKARFLEQLRDELGLSMTVHHGRAESLAEPPLAESFDVVTARAVAPLSRLVGWCAPYLRSGGTLHAIKGERWEQELEEARSAIPAAGLTVQRLPEVAVRAEGDMRPLVVVLERTATTGRRRGAPGGTAVGRTTKNVR
jgi:16S rRNA (guanine527-N7)-methyltransferase